MRNLSESILASRDETSNRAKNIIEDMRCLAYFILNWSGGGYGPASDFDLFKLVDSNAIKNDAKKFVDNRLGVNLEQYLFSKYRIGRDHNAALNSWLLKLLILIIIYSRFKNPITDETIDKDLKNLSKYLTEKYCTKGRINITYWRGKDIRDSDDTTGTLDIVIETNPHRTKNDDEEEHPILLDCKMRYKINLNK